MKFRIILSTVSLSAIVFASVACNDGQPEPAGSAPPPTKASATASIAAQTSLHTSAPASETVQAQTPAPNTVPAPVSTVRPPTPGPTKASATASISTLSQLSAPVQTPDQTPLPKRLPSDAPVSAPTPTPIPTPAPVSTQPPTPTPAPVYLTQEIPPCTSIPGSPVDPCETRAERDVTTHSDGLILVVPALLVDDLLEGDPTTPIHVTHIALRVTYLPGTVRCTTGNRHGYPSYRSPGGLVGALLIYCYADVRVNAYVLGSGATTLTVIVGTSLYALPGTTDEDYGLDQLESRRLAYERALVEGGRFEYDRPLEGYLGPGGGAAPLRFEHRRNSLAATGPPGGIGGREVVLFIAPLFNTSVEAWRMRHTWDVERREDGSVVAIHPNREWMTSAEYRSVGEWALPALTQAVTNAHQARVAANGGRIGADESLPMLETDANRLRQYFSDPKVGAYAPGAPTPTHPPPPCGLAVPDQADNPGLMRDCINLLGLKDTLRGTATLNWSVDTAITSWDGVKVSGSPVRVTSLVLVSEGLTGTIPPDLARLDGLEYLWLGYNQLTGEIPAALGGLASLKSLLFNRNRLTGAVPRELGGLSRLESLWLNENQLSGEIPASLGDLGNLRQLLLAGNRLSGAIPSVLGDLSNLEHLKLNYNQLTGEIPATLGRLSNLKDLLLGVNQLTGCIPPALRNVDDNDLDSLGLQDCAAP